VFVRELLPSQRNSAQNLSRFGADRPKGIGVDCRSFEMGRLVAIPIQNGLLTGQFFNQSKEVAKWDVGATHTV
jgi:hypothetical protein